MVRPKGSRCPALRAYPLGVLVLSVACGESQSSDDTGDAGAGETSDVFFVTGTLGGVERYAPYNITAVSPGDMPVVATTSADPTSPWWYVYVPWPEGPLPITFSCASRGYYISFLEGNGVEYSGRATGDCEVEFESIEEDAWEGTFSARLLFTVTDEEVSLTDGRFRLPRAE